MKGFGIEIKNNLLEVKHVKNMDIAVWLYMWLVDKITRVDEDGTGWVLGGKPIKFEEVQAELGISADTYTRWIEKLCEYPYIKAIRTPHGVSYRVFKAYKRFRKNAETDSAEVRNPLRKNAESNKTYTVDSINIPRAQKARVKSKFKAYDENNPDTGEDVVDLDGNDDLPQAPKINLTEKYWQMIRWAEERRGRKFIRGAGIKKQFAAFAHARNAGISPGDLKQRWEEMEESDYWQERGFDWMSVVTSFNRKA